MTMQLECKKEFSYHAAPSFCVLVKHATCYINEHITCLFIFVVFYEYPDGYDVSKHPRFCRLR